AGTQGTVVHYNGSSWVVMNSPNPFALISGIWGFSSSSVFVSSNLGGDIWNGASWTHMPGSPPATGGIWGSSSTDLFVPFSQFLSGHFVYHYDGVNWTQQTTPIPADLFVTLRAVWGSSGSNVYAAGGGALTGVALQIVHYNGTSWSDE